jgi:DNA-binding Lrp family transcriptional regulator
MLENGLDLKDRKILSQLDINARQTNVEIGRKVRLSKEVVNYRIQRLEKEGFIKGYQTIIDTSKLGYSTLRIHLKFQDIKLEKEKEILDILKKKKKIIYILKTDGPWDISFGFLARDIFEFNDFYKEFKSIFKEYYDKEDFAIYSGVYLFNRGYLLGGKNKSVIIKIVNPDAKELDKKDMEIIKIISSNARISIIDISNKIDIPASTIAFRIRQLEKQGVILGYTLLFDFKKIDYSYFKLKLNLRDVKNLNKIIEFCSREPNMIYAVETLGGEDLELFLEVRNNLQMIEIVDRLRQNFPEIRKWGYYNLEGYEKFVYF